MLCEEGDLLVEGAHVDGGSLARLLRLLQCTVCLGLGIGGGEVGSGHFARAANTGSCVLKAG